MHKQITETAKKSGKSNTTALQRDAMPANTPNLIKFHNVGLDIALYALQTISSTKTANNNSTQNLGTYQMHTGCKMVHIPVKKANLVDWKILYEIKKVHIPRMPRRMD